MNWCYSTSYGKYHFNTDIEGGIGVIPKNYRRYQFSLDIEEGIGVVKKTIGDINLTQILKDKLVLFEIQRKLILKRHRSAGMGSQCTTEKVKNLRYVMPIVMVPWCTVT